MRAPAALLAVTAAFLPFYVLPHPAHAGPPLICHPVDTGGEPSLPLAGTGWKDVRADYPLQNLLADTLALLTPKTRVLARMETLRRASIYAAKDEAIAARLIGGLLGRAQGSPDRCEDALAAFDAGYLASCMRQVRSRGFVPGTGHSAADDVDGYLWIARALALRGADAEMEFAAALVCMVPRRDEIAGHLSRAKTGAAAGSALARNLASRADWFARVPRVH